ncbi:large conductance mechanosensitive channel protein MscL [Nesterenkonia alba]|uniref:large conductance mechanosensitive channel protein MscL n=1 Tax=Nesterenkonia alba TaxID=515814 RepID=UPI0003B697EE
MLKGFLNFIKQGNVVDLAVAVVLGAAFGAVVNALVEHVLMPLIGQLFAQDPDFDNLFTLVLPGLDGPPMRFGILLTQVVNFLLIAAAIYFVIVMPMNKMIEARNAALGEPEEAPEENIVLLREIRDQLKAQTEVTNPAFIQSLVEAEKKAEEEQQAKEEAEAKSGLLGRAKTIVWGKD